MSALLGILGVVVGAVLTMWLRERADRRLDRDRQALREADRVHERRFVRIEELTSALTELYFEHQVLTEQHLTRGERALQDAQLYLVEPGLAQRVRAMLNNYRSVFHLHEDRSGGQRESWWLAVKHVQDHHQPLLAELRQLVGIEAMRDDRAALPSPENPQKSLKPRS